MNNLTLDEVGEYLDQWHRYTHYGMALCPYHDDKNPSLRVSEHRYKCLSCGASGSLEKLYQHVSGRVVARERTYNQAAFVWKKWEERFGSIQAIAKIAHQELLNDPNLGSYLVKRGIDSHINTGKFGFLDGYYTFPVINEYNEIHGVVVRASPTIQTKNNRYSVSYGCHTKLYIPSWKNVLKAEDLYVCYGTIDAWSLHMAGYAGITGISGQELSAENLDRFRKRIFIIPDKGEEKSALYLQARLGWRACPLFLDWPDGTKDINGVHTLYSLDTVSKLIEKAKEKYNYD